MNHRPNPLLILSVCLFFLSLRSSLFAEDPCHFFKYSLKDIENAEGRLRLSLSRTWGGDEADDEKQFFRMPTDIKINANNQVYIVDNESHQITVFKRNGEYIRTIGRRGQGPGDFLHPISVFFLQDQKLAVCETGNRRIQVLTPEGKSLKVYRFTSNFVPSQIQLTPEGHILAIDYERAYKTGKILTYGKVGGKTEMEIGGVLRKGNHYEDYEAFDFIADSHYVWISYSFTPLYRKYSISGKLIQSVTFEAPFESGAVPVDNADNREGRLLPANTSRNNVAGSIYTDQKGRVFLSVFTRPPNEKEKKKFYITGEPRKPDSHALASDRFRILVFDPSGKLIAAKKLTVEVTGLYIHEDRLFIIDSFTAMAVREYHMTPPLLD